MVVAHTGDGQRVEGAGTIIGRIGENIHGEDDIVCGNGLTIGELCVVAELDVVIHRAVAVLGLFEVAESGICIVSSVVSSCLALNTLVDDGAFPVLAEQGSLGHAGNVNIISRCCEERGELLVELGLAHNQGIALGTRIA